MTFDDSFLQRRQSVAIETAEESTAPTVLTFETVDVTNVDKVHPAHVQRIIYTLLDSNTIELEIVWNRGKSQEPEQYRLHRI